MRARAICAVMVAATACGGEGKQIPREQITDPGQALFNGFSNSRATCYECHNGDGSGTKWGPALATRVPRRTDDQLRHAILEGSGKMPAFKSKLSDVELAALVTWLRARFDHPQPQAPVGA